MDSGIRDKNFVCKISSSSSTNAILGVRLLFFFFI